MKNPIPSDSARNGWWRRAILALTLLSWQLVTLAQDYPPGACTLVPGSKTCVDSTPCKTAATGEHVCLAGVPVSTGGFNVPQTCWQYSYQYACAGDVQDTCAPYENNAACGVVASSCQDYQQPAGTCDSWNYTYECQTSAAQTGQQVQCSSGLFNTSLMSTPTNTNNTFVLAAIAQEMLRESQLYSQNGSSIFAGVAETCTKGDLGLKNCCKSAPGAKTNAVMSSLVMGAASSVVRYVGQGAMNIASQYMFDAMYSNGLWTSAMDLVFTTEYAYGQTALVQSAASGFQIGAFGVTYSSTAAVGGATATGATGGGLFGADTILLNFGDEGVLLFNPYTFIIAVVILIITSLMQCTSEEQMLAMHKGADLSVYEGETCTSSFLGACMEYTDSYCSFNSVLAKIINTAGKQQLGLNPKDCSGFSVAQLQQINFSIIDFSEFTASVAAQAKQSMPTSAAIQQSYSSALQNTTGGSAQAGTLIPGSSIIGGVPASTPPAPNTNLPTYPTTTTTTTTTGP